MNLCFLRLLVCSTCLATTLLAQASAAIKPAPKVDARNSYSRVIAVVPIVGSGTVADPKRPKYTPWPPAKGQSPTDIIGYSHIVTDNGQSAIVEFVARNRSAFQAILADKSITVFEKGKDKKNDIETALRKVKSDFSFDKYGMAVR